MWGREKLLFVVVPPSRGALRASIIVHSKWVAKLSVWISRKCVVVEALGGTLNNHSEGKIAGMFAKRVANLLQFKIFRN